MRQHERVGLGRLEAFVRKTVLQHTHPNTKEQRRVLEALGEAGGLFSGDVILCTREAGRQDPDERP
ncbi:hypothetical protein ACIREM_28975 [Streptomyces shenzhenensis]|uniref:hypothetical protein n=1 Tax=Streptomyces shenzhenensis TaxID=943815 RepID=UPI00380FDD81